MKCRMFALSLALGALLCLAPSAAALEPQPEVPAPDTAAASQTDTPAAPAKASNAGGVATSGLEMSQNSERLSWSFEEVDAKLKGIMEGIFHASYDASVAAGSEGNLMVGANCAGFLKVATAMMAQGITY